MSDVAKKLLCDLHGESHATFVCSHLAFNSGLGFHTAEASDDPRPDAWCSECDKILRREGEWNDRAEAFARITLLCAGCYDVAAFRNRERSPVLSAEGFICGTCEKRHHTLPLDFAAKVPDPYKEIPKEERSRRCRLSDDLCTIDNEHFFVRGCLELPLIDAPEALVFGVWGSLSRAHFDRYVELWNSDERIQEPPYFSWLSTSLPLYPETFLLKAHVLQRPQGMRPYICLQPTDHPLAIEQRTGITVVRAMEIAAQLMHPAGSS